MNMFELNRIAIWRPKAIDSLTIREAGAGRPYIENKIISKTKKKTYRYAKNYVVGETKFCLFVNTYSKNKKQVEADLDRIALVIDEAQAQEVAIEQDFMSFKYTDYFIKENKK